MGNPGSVADEIYYDPYDYGIDADPHPLWRRMRDERPLYYNERFNFYAVSRYADVRRMALDWQTFSSARGSILELIDAPPEILESIRNILFEDPPIHDLHRMLLARAFSPKRIADLEVKIRAMCAEYLDPFVGAGTFDYVAEFGRKVPMMVIGMLLGVPEADREYLQDLATAAVHIEEGETGLKAEAQQAVGEYFAHLVSLRRADPQDDLTTVLIEAEFDDDRGVHRRLDDGELLRYLTLVSGAGNETVTNLMGWAGITLHRCPEERRKLVNDPGLIPNAIEELLRYEAPSPVQARYVTRDVEVYDQTVPAGSKMLLINASANRDERAFAEPPPDVFAVERAINQHVSFGHGVHFCLGATLARLEGRIALEETLKRFPQWTVDEEHAEMVHTSTVRGWEKLPIITG